MEVSAKTLNPPGAFLWGSTVPLPLEAEIAGGRPDREGGNPSILKLCDLPVETKEAPKAPILSYG